MTTSGIASARIKVVIGLLKQTSKRFLCMSAQVWRNSKSMIPIGKEQEKIQDGSQRRLTWKKLELLRYAKGIQIRPGVSGISSQIAVELV
jgi:hypothetical protein